MLLFVFIFLIGHCVTEEFQVYNPDADAFIGVSLCFRNPLPNKTCDVEGYSHISECYEAILWIIDILNQNNGSVFGIPVNDSFIPGIKLGLKVFDDCAKVDFAINNLRNMTSYNASDDPKFLGVIGSCGIYQTLRMAHYLRPFGIPILNPLFGTLSQAKESLSAFPNLFSVFPANGLRQLNMAIFDLIEQFNWQKVSVLYEDDYDWKNYLVNNFLRWISRTICIGNVIRVPKNGDSEKYRDILQALIESRPATGVVYLSGSSSTLEKLLQIAESVSNVTALHWIIYDQDNMEFVLENHINITKGAFLVQHNTIRPKGLSEYIYSKTPLVSYSNDPWFVYYFMKTKRCYLSNYNFYPYNENPPCSNFTYDKEYLLTYIFHPSCINAVYIFANALKNAWNEKCNGQSGMCRKLKHLHPRNFTRHYIRRVNFTYDEENRSPPRMHNITMAFNSKNQITWRDFTYGIRNLQEKPGFKFPKVFSYNEDYGLFQLMNYKFYNIHGYSLRNNIAPLSFCNSADCFADVCYSTLPKKNV